MINADRQQFATVIGSLFAVFDHDLPAPLLGVWWEALKDLELTDIKMATAKLISSEDKAYRPLPGRIRKEVEGNAEVPAMLAWDELNNAIMRYGVYRNPEFTDPKIAAIVQQHGGWVRICGLTTKDFDTWFRKSFFEDYGTLTPELTKRLVGLTQIENARKDKLLTLDEVLKESDRMSAECFGE